jgi:hypothetical protein
MTTSKKHIETMTNWIDLDPPVTRIMDSIRFITFIFIKYFYLII